MSPASQRVDGFINGFVLSALILCAVACVFVLFTISWGGETLESFQGRLVAWWFLTGIAAYVVLRWAHRHWQNGNSFYAAGIALSALAALLAMAAEQIRFSSDAPFVRQEWLAAGPKPEAMAKGLVRGKTVIGKSKAELVALLGEPQSSTGDRERGGVEYGVDGGWTLFVHFVGDRAVEAGMRQAFLSV